MLTPIDTTTPEGLLAEAAWAIKNEDAPNARRALGAAGDHPLAAYLQGSLDELELGVAEARAGKHWIRKVSWALAVPRLHGWQAERAGTALSDFMKKYGETKFAKEKGEQIALLRGRIGGVPVNIEEPDPDDGDRSEPHAHRGADVPGGWPFGATEAARRQMAAADRLRLSVEKTVSLGGGARLELVLIPPGEFMMGSKSDAEEILGKGEMRLYKQADCEREIPRHRVRITKPFYMGKYEVTQKAWNEVMGKGPAFEGERDPAANVTWHMCQEFVRELTSRVGKKHGLVFRLPTDAEWEYACRAGTDTPFWFGESITTDLANYNGEFAWDGKKGMNRGKALPVGSFKPNPWGLYDTAGNVIEWCDDGLREYGSMTETDPRGPVPSDEGKAQGVLRGGSWYISPIACRSAARLTRHAKYRNWYDDGYGLRVVAIPSAR
jgi:formylglycine-generating enzyme required for sulfatase activity